MSEVGSRAAQRDSVRGVPTLLIFDGEGKLVDRRVGIPSRGAVVAKVLDLTE